MAYNFFFINIFTFFLDSLNTKNFVVLVACVSPNIDDVNETLATLRFAEKTKAVISRPQLESIALEFEVNNFTCFLTH